jgi:hypothetical protein
MFKCEQNEATSKEDMGKGLSLGPLLVVMLIACCDVEAMVVVEEELQLKT